MMMQPKAQTFTIKGMRRDLSKGIFDSNYAFEIKNMRITTREDNTLLSLTNEKGNLEIAVTNVSSIQGSLIGWCVLNQTIILFTTDNTTSYIYKIVIGESSSVGTVLFQGNLNLSTDYPVEAIGVYENENIQKVYWVDGRNQPRVLNLNTSYTNADSFNFTNKINLTHSQPIIDKINSGGIFPAGVIQYAFSYYNLYGQETNLFEVTPLYYLSPKERGLAPGETASCSFKITLGNLDTNFDFIRIYSIVRTSINGTPIVKRVADLKFTEDDLIYTDNGTTGDIIDPQQLLFIGGESIIAGTMAHKDNTLFLGNIKLNRENIGTLPVNDSQIKDVARQIVIDNPYRVLDYNEDISSDSFYGYKINNNKSSQQKRTFKSNEVYRLGFIAQHETGKWSEPIWIKDLKNSKFPTIVPPTESTQGEVKVGSFTADLAVLKSALQSAGYQRVAPVVVLPEASDRNVITQGIVCPTVYNVFDRSRNAPFVQSSWFIRTEGTSFKHDTTIATSNKSQGEIQMIQDPINTPYLEYTEDGTRKKMSGAEFVGFFGENYFIDCSIVTLHTPEIEFGNDLTQGALDESSLGIIGYTQFNSFASDIEVTTSSVGKDINNSGFIKNVVGAKGQYLMASDLWVDKAVNYSEQNPNLYGFVVYPWHRSGSLNDDKIPDENATTKRTALLERKKMSHLAYGIPNYDSFGYIWNSAVTTPQVFNSDSIVTLRIPSPKNSGLPALTYQGNVDRLLTPNLVDMSGKTLHNERDSTLIPAGDIPGKNKQEGYPIYSGFRKYIGTDSGLRLTQNYYKSPMELSGKIPLYTTYHSKDTDPIHIKYKSAPHAVFAFDYFSSGNQVILPDGGNYTLQFPPFWKSDLSDTYAARSSASSIGIGKPVNSLWIGELFRYVNDSTRFGGDTPQALQNNQWLVAGPAVHLNSSTIINFYEGDTYFARYDSLKTYPFTLEDTNSVTEIVSTMIESRINLDLRYDRNRGNTNNLVMHPGIFNLFNPVYEQKNNYFIYRTLDYNRFNIDDFYNSITWTLEKTLAEEVDKWTTLTLANTLDLDGDKGKITSLNIFNNEIYCFQERGLSNILFNSRVQIPASDGVPIEISSGARVGGKRYVSNTIGCYNKSSIAETPNGIYFFDNITNSIYQFTGQQIRSISDEKGFRQWVSDNNVSKKWDPVNFNNFITFYDANNNDVYFTNKNTSLCYSELLQEFTGFMSYERTPAMFNVGSKLFAVKNNKLWEQFAGAYNSYYGVHQPYSITYIANGGGVLKDRIFNYVEFKADMHDQYDTYLPTHTFDSLEVKTEYQQGTSILLDTLGNPSNLKKKFNLWRAQVPRDESNGRDRIRNPWCHVKLGRLCEDTHKMNLHNVTIYYNE